MNPAIPEVTPEQIEKQFNTVENDFAAAEQRIKSLRTFIETHKSDLSPFVFSCSFAYGEAGIEFDCTYNNKDQARNIANAFGKDGWTRKKDTFTCGRINWHKNIDEIQLTITGAEHLNPNLIEQVKL